MGDFSAFCWGLWLPTLQLPLCPGNLLGHLHADFTKLHLGGTVRASDVNFLQMERDIQFLGELSILKEFKGGPASCWSLKITQMELLSSVRCFKPVLRNV